MPDTTIDKSVFLSSQTVEWPTPQYLFEQLDREFHFTVDVAANPTNAKCPKFYTVDDDGISQDWDGETVWCNPPYGDQLKHWVWKAAHSACTTVMLVPARTDVKWFHDYVIPTAEVRFIKGRLKFGDATTPAPFPTMLCIWRNAQPTVQERAFCHAKHICHHWWEDECSDACDRGEHNHPINACPQPTELESE